MYIFIFLVVIGIIIGCSIAAELSPIWRFEEGTYLCNGVDNRVMRVLEDDGYVVHCQEIGEGMSWKDQHLLFHRKRHKTVYDGRKMWSRLDDFEGKMRELIDG